ncbi:TPA: hypothetical protein ACXEZB_004390 [Escherichia coli]
MAVQDIFDRFYGGDNTDPLKQNSLGQSLAPSLTQQTGQTPAVDPLNDERSPWDVKTKAQEFNQILSSGEDQDDENYYTSKHGNKYRKVDDSDWQVGLTAAANYLSTYLSTGGDAGAGGKAAGQAVWKLHKQADAFGKIDQLEDAGANTTDITTYLDTLDSKDLQTNMGKWTPIGNGAYVNSLTGETRQLPGAMSQKQQNAQVVDLGDRKMLIHADGTREEISKGAAPKQGAKGGSIGLDEDEAGNNSGFVFENGQWVQHTTYSNGQPRTIVANATQQKQLNEQQAASQPNAQQTQMSGDLATLSSAIDSNNVGGFTGQVVSRLPGVVSDVLSTANPTERAAYNAATRIEGNMQNMGIAAATEMGASGINTEAEAERYFKSMPRLDKTSPEALKASVQAIQAYTQNYNATKAQQKGATPPAPAATAPAGKKDFSGMW